MLLGGGGCIRNRGNRRLLVPRGAAAAWSSPGVRARPGRGWERRRGGFGGGCSSTAPCLGGKGLKDGCCLQGYREPRFPAPCSVARGRSPPPAASGPSALCSGNCDGARAALCSEDSDGEGMMRLRCLSFPLPPSPTAYMGGLLKSLEKRAGGGKEIDLLLQIHWLSEHWKGCRPGSYGAAA